MTSAAPRIEVENGIARFPGAGIGLIWGAVILVIMILMALSLPVVMLSTATAETMVGHVAIALLWLMIMSPVAYFLHKAPATSTVKIDLARRVMRIDMLGLTFLASSLEFPLADITAIELAAISDAGFDGPPLPRAVLRLKDGRWIGITNSYSQSLFPSFDAQKVREAGALVEAVQGLLRSAKASGGAVPSTV